MTVTRISDTVVPGGVAPSNTDAADQPAARPRRSPPSHDDLLRNSLAISDRLADEQRGNP